MRKTACLAFLVLVVGCSESRETVPDGQVVHDAQTGGDDAASSSNDAASGLACGTRGGASCDDGEVCIFPPGECGAADGGGECVARPGVCPDVRAPVCGCDGTTYGNECEAHAAGASIARTGECGATSCDRRDVRCRAVEPTCPEGQVASVVAQCWGPCVAIDECSCTEADACPNRDQYTCHMHRQRCGPYL
ncbi:hypothetical protein [Sandaracinus amylolyticus]|uniref:hypothetical protein n=1 Tax=Sandaracinus amylolyticus TaxID=927083 RepID=UPI001F387E41|nr:hypothetical protein [Sandaracinus amylolyticus]UJR85064.1 Hypothetical protein I5071_71430 [Sandaracinus amylolyticus]